jgi:hypothetical protein
MKPGSSHTSDRSQAPCARWVLLILLIGVLAAAPCRAAAADFPQLIATFAALGDRSTGTPGNARAAGFIKETLTQIGVGAVESHQFAVPVIRNTASSLTVRERGLTMPLLPLAGNAISPQAIAPPGITGPLVYAGDGSHARLNGRRVAGAVLLMELDSAKNWLQAASLGASALIYVDRGGSTRMDFEEKFEL